MAVNKAELYTGLSYTIPDTTTDEYKTVKVNPFIAETATSAVKPLQRDSKGNLLFGNNIVPPEENGLTKQPAFKFVEKFGLNKFGNIAHQQLSSYLRHVESWDKAVDPNAASVIRSNWPSLENIQVAVGSNQRLLYLAQQANQDYV